MDEIRLEARAKINLGLDVLRRREDGYHEVKMVMQTVDICDVDSPLSRAARFAENSLDQSVTVAKMAEIAGYHPAHFTKLFQQRMGISPVQFLIHKKTEAAIEQLTATSLPISSIAESLGFGSQFYFSNFFKKQTGMTPSEYRKAFSRPHA